MNIAQMLAHGPKLQAPAVPVARSRKSEQRYINERNVEKYRNASEGDVLWSTLIAARLGIGIPSATKRLKIFHEAGYLEIIGKAESSSQNKPHLYRWISNAELCGGPLGPSERAPG